MRRTEFRALRNFYFSGRTVRAGELLDLTDAEAATLIWMTNTIEPTAKRDRPRVLTAPRVSWDAPQVETPARPSMVGRIGTADRDAWPPIAA